MGNESTLTEYGAISNEFKCGRLTDLCVAKIGVQTGPFGSQLHKKDYVEIGTPIITVEHLGENRIVHFNTPFVSDEDKQRLSKYLLREGDIVFSRVGSVDRRALVGNQEDGWLFSGRCLRVRVDKSKIDPRFLSYFFGHEGFKNHIRSIAVGATMPSINTKILSDINVYYPDKQEQKAIAHVLGSLDDRIELNRRMNETLESMAQALFKSWFVDFDPVIDNALANGKEIPAELSEKAQARAALDDKRRPLPEEIRTLFPDEFTHSDDLGWIPKGWDLSSVGKEFDVTMGQSPPGTTYNADGEGIAFFQGRADFGFRYPSNRIYCTAPKRFANKGDTLVSVRAPVGDVNMAHIDCCIGRGVGAVRHNAGCRSFTYYSMLDLREHFNKFEAEGTVFGSINQKDFKALLQLKKDNKLLEAFEAQAGAFDGKIEQNSLAILNLIQLRDTLLPKLLSGEIRIPDAEKMVKDLAL